MDFLHVMEFGSLSSWVTAGGVVGMFLTALRLIPAWVRAKSEERASDSEIARELRNELLQRLNECEEKHKKIYKENKELRKRITKLEDGDRRKTIALTLLMNEVSRIDPSSDIIDRAKAVLQISIELNQQLDAGISEAMEKLDEEE